MTKEIMEILYDLQEDIRSENWGYDGTWTETMDEWLDKWISDKTKENENSEGNG